MSAAFLQSVEWENFQKSVGRRVWRMGDSLLIRHDLPGGFNYLYCPRPELVIDNWLLDTQNIAKEEESVFLKIDPIDELQVTSYRLQVASSLQPQKTVIVDLQKSEEELLRAMHPKTRYNIRLAERKGVVVEPVGEPTTTDSMIWRNLISATAHRENFYTHERSYYEKLLRVRSEHFSNELFLADYSMTTLAGAIVNFYQPSQTATYLHGASLRENKEIMASYLLNWRIMQEARRRGFMFYDLWGIDEKKWPGITRFKLGFGGKVVEYPPSVDLVYRPLLYKLYKFVRLIRSK